MGCRSALFATLALTVAAVPPALAESLTAPRGERSLPGVVFARQVVPAAATGNTLAITRTIYLNRQGVTLRPGPNNSQANTSTVVARTSEVPAWQVSDPDWAATVACMAEIWSPFDVTVTDVDPGATPHVEAVFGGAPSDVGLDDDIGGISPFTSDCSVIERSIVFAFTSNLPRRPRVVCEVMSQEIAHSYGLDHELAADDPMSYLAYAGNRRFQDRDVACGETTARPCGISGTACRPSQNSFQLLRARLGAADRDNEPPLVAITAPAESASVAAGFSITATATDNIAVESVAVYVDGELLATTTSEPYRFTTDPGLLRGVHTIVVEATDGDGNTATIERDVMVNGDGDGGIPLGLGCATTGQPAAGLGILVAAALARRRRRAQRAR